MYVQAHAFAAGVMLAAVEVCVTRSVSCDGDRNRAKVSTGCHAKSPAMEVLAVFEEGPGSNKVWACDRMRKDVQVCKSKDNQGATRVGYKTVPYLPSVNGEVVKATCTKTLLSVIDPSPS